MHASTRLCRLRLALIRHLYTDESFRAKDGELKEEVKRRVEGLGVLGEEGEVVSVWRPAEAGEDQRGVQVRE